MIKIEKPWVAFGSMVKTRYGLIIEELPGGVLIKCYENQTCNPEAWKSEYIERFEDPSRLADYLFGKIDKLPYLIINDLKGRFPMAFKTIDNRGCYFTKPISPLDVMEWEDMQIKGETACIITIDDARKQMTELGDIICRFSSEIFRLRLTYGEEVWTSVNHSREENDLIRKTHEAERGKYQIKKEMKK